jgi:hypothetical protein
MKKIYLLIIGTIFTVAGFTVVNANPSQFMKSFASSTGSTLASPTYTLAGKATSTVSIYNADSITTKYDKALVRFQVTSTTTPPTVLFRTEISNDGSTWFAYDNATSTLALAPTVNSFTFSSTTYSDYNGPSGDSTKNNGSFTVDIDAPYVRVVSYSPIGNPAYNIFIAATPVRELK